jgi:hypothetical protein
VIALVLIANHDLVAGILNGTDSSRRHSNRWTRPRLKVGNSAKIIGCPPLFSTSSASSAEATAFRLNNDHYYAGLTRTSEKEAERIVAPCGLDATAQLALQDSPLLLERRNSPLHAGISA